MDHFAYRNGRLCAEEVPLSGIASEVGTPFYCYSTATLERHYHAFEEAFHGQKASICYAVKANSNIAVIATLARLGAGADVVSGGEMKRALAAGVAPGRIIFSGVGKTREEISAAMQASIFQINVESEPELEVLNEVAEARGVAAPTSLRVNPDVDANTHRKITTGKGENKFGVDINRVPELYARAAAMPGIDVKGLAVHIGSQLVELGPFGAAFAKLRELTEVLRGQGLDVERLDLGGGLGIPYAPGDKIPTPAQYAGLVKEELGGLGCELTLEPGRVIVGNAGVMVCSVIYVKESAARTFVVVDAAMNDLIRPALYNSDHAIVPLEEPYAGDQTSNADVVGPICESGDTFAVQVPLPPLAAGDMIALRTAGAYGSVMSSTYNSRPLIPEVMVRGDGFSVVRERIGVDDMLARESLPGWLDDG